jgi:hypothetical protein
MSPDICSVCGKPIDPEDLVVRPVMVARQTHWEPEEFIDVTLHQQCADEPERDEAYERAAARYDGEGKDWR